MNERKKLSFYIIAGEASGDLLGAHLMQSLKEISVTAPLFAGIGGEKMAAQGLTSLFPYNELSMMGFVEILPYIFNLTAKLGLTVEDIIAKQPDVVITIDSPGFNFRLVKKLRAAGVTAKFIHYVAPTVWAYKPERAQKCAELFDHMLVLLPFEPPYFEKVGLPCTFVGHPVVSETATGDGNAFREKYAIPHDTLLFSLLPGSRKGEVERHMPIFGKAIILLSTYYPGLAMVVAVPKHVMAFVAPYFEGCPFRTIVTANEEEKKNAIAASNFALTKSGTVALEVAMAGIPMIITYRVHALSAWLLRRMAQIKYVNLINILNDKEIIPELIQELCTPPMIACAVTGLLSNETRQQSQKEQMQIALAKLHSPTGNRPSDIAANTVLGLLQ